MKKRIVLWSMIVGILAIFTLGFSDGVQTCHKMVKVGGTANHCDCTYRIQ